MLSPAVYGVNADGILLATGRLDQAVDQVYIGDSCTRCPNGSQSLKVLVRSCVPFLWTLKKQTSQLVLKGENKDDFATWQYIREGSWNTEDLTFEYTCQADDVRTYWRETCLSNTELENECFAFQLGPHPDWERPVESPLIDEKPATGSKPNTEIVLLVDDKEIQVGKALLGQAASTSFSFIEGLFGGGCDPDDE